MGGRSFYNVDGVELRKFLLPNDNEIEDAPVKSVQWLTRTGPCGGLTWTTMACIDNAQSAHFLCCCLSFIRRNPHPWCRRYGNFTPCRSSFPCNADTLIPTGNGKVASISRSSRSWSSSLRVQVFQLKVSLSAYQYECVIYHSCLVGAGIVNVKVLETNEISGRNFNDAHISY